MRKFWFSEPFHKQQKCFLAARQHLLNLYIKLLRYIQVEDDIYCLGRLILHRFFLKLLDKNGIINCYKCCNIIEYHWLVYSICKRIVWRLNLGHNSSSPHTAKNGENVSNANNVLGYAVLLHNSSNWTPIKNAWKTIKLYVGRTCPKNKTELGKYWILKAFS